MEKTGAAWRLTHSPALDGLRGLAILLVMLSHTQVAAVHAAGTVGVTMFFTLSGFLITALLLQDVDEYGAVRLRRFFRHRARRLLPALLLFLTAMTALGFASRSPVAPGLRDVLGALLYVGNYTGAMDGRDTAILHTWSLAVEEQFYVAWPLVLMLLLRMGGGRWLMPVMSAVCLIVVVARFAVWDGGAGIVRVTYGTDMRLDALVAGCLVAIFVRRWGAVSARLWAGTTPVAIVFLFALSFLGIAWEALVVTVLVPVVTALVILRILEGGGSWMGSRPLALLGRRSYGIYLWHYPIFALAAAAPDGRRLASWSAALVVTAALAHLSWRCVEQPFAKKSVSGPPKIGDGSTSGLGCGLTSVAVGHPARADVAPSRGPHPRIIRGRRAGEPHFPLG